VKDTRTSAVQLFHKSHQHITRN